MKNVIEAWKKEGIVRAEFHFQCGGDSMNDTHFEFFGKDDEAIMNFSLDNTLEDEVYKRVEFYEASDGHYQGESGIVHITLNEEETDFEFIKDSESEWTENMQTDIWVDLEPEEIDFVQKYVENIQGGEGEYPSVNYKISFIMTEKLEEIEKSLLGKIDEVAEDFCPEIDEEVQDWFNYTTNEIEVKDGKLKVEVTNYYYHYTRD